MMIAVMNMRPVWLFLFCSSCFSCKVSQAFDAKLLGSTTTSSSLVDHESPDDAARHRKALEKNDFETWRQQLAAMPPSIKDKSNDPDSSLLADQLEDILAKSEEAWEMLRQEVSEGPLQLANNYDTLDKSKLEELQAKAQDLLKRMDSHAELEATQGNSPEHVEKTNSFVQETQNLLDEMFQVVVGTKGMRRFLQEDDDSTLSPAEILLVVLASLIGIPIMLPIFAVGATIGLLLNILFFIVLWLVLLLTSPVVAGAVLCCPAGTAAMSLMELWDNGEDRADYAANEQDALSDEDFVMEYEKLLESTIPLLIDAATQEAG